jgi:hypothetical protein
MIDTATNRYLICLLVASHTLAILFLASLTVGVGNGSPA